jgi:hypothetical protein
MANALDTRPDACRRTTEAIHADLAVNLQGKGIPLCESLNKLLFSQWDNKYLARDAVREWLAGNASVCGTGYFPVRFTSWRVPKSISTLHGGRGHIQCSKQVQCSKHGCSWHLEYEEAKDRKIVFYDAVLEHDEPEKHTAVGASDLDVAAMQHNITVAMRDIRDAMNLGKTNPSEYHELLEIATGAAERMRDLVRKSQEQRRRKRAGTTDQVDDEGDGEVHHRIVHNAEQADPEHRRRIRNKGDQ